MERERGWEHKLMLIFNSAKKYKSMLEKGRTYMTVNLYVINVFTE